jgi:hypothetical protein
MPQSAEERLTGNPLITAQQEGSWSQHSGGQPDQERCSFMPNYRHN